MSWIHDLGMSISRQVKVYVHESFRMVTLNLISLPLTSPELGFTIPNARTVQMLGGGFFPMMSKCGGGWLCNSPPN